MPFDAVKCTVDSVGNNYHITMTVRYLNASGQVINIFPISADVEKGDIATMRSALVATIRPMLDAAVVKLKEAETGTTNLVGAIMAQVNTYLATKS